MIELADCGRIDMVPIGSAIIRNIESAIPSDHHVATIVRVDPKIVAVSVNTSTKVAIECNTAILRFELRNSENIDTLCIVGVNFDDTEVHGTRIERVHAFPSFATIVGAIDSAIFVSLCPLHVLDVRGLSEVRVGVGAFVRLATLAGRKGDFQLFALGSSEHRDLRLVTRLALANRRNERFEIGDRFSS